MDEVKCAKCKQANVKHKKLKLCGGCYKVRRAAQAKRNAKTFAANRKAGKVKPSFWYKGAPTVSALAKPAQARAAFEKAKQADRIKALEKALEKKAA